MNLSYPQNYIEYVVHFHGDRDYFECHEVLEEHWKAEGMGRNSVWTGLIQVAVALYHHRSQNFRGAGKMIGKALDNLGQKHREIQALGIDYFPFIQLLNGCARNIDNRLPYQPVMLPIYDLELLDLCASITNSRNYGWGSPENLDDEHLVFRHKMRDRKAVIEERQNALRHRQKQRLKEAEQNRKLG